jgi:hypothetical protein
VQSYNTTSLLPVKVFSLIERIFLASIAEDYVRENHFVYKFWGETSVYRDYFFKYPGGRKALVINREQRRIPYFQNRPCFLHVFEAYKPPCLWDTAQDY